MKVLTEHTTFTSPNGDGTVILRSHPSYAKSWPTAVLCLLEEALTNFFPPQMRELRSRRPKVISPEVMSPEARVMSPEIAGDMT